MAEWSLAASPLVVIVGPTASGKTALGIELAKKFNGEIICADSRTIYRGMDIGTAKPTKAEQETIKHHLINIVKPNEKFTAADFKQQANYAIIDIAKRDKSPILVGGTGLYVDSVIYDYQFSPDGREKDPINPRHLKRSHNNDNIVRPNTLILGLRQDKSDLRHRVTKRVDLMVEQDLEEETKGLIAKYGTDIEPLKTPGYKAFAQYLSGALSLDEAKAEFIKSDMQLAKRQMTWFKRNNSIHWLDYPSEASGLVKTFLNKTK